MNYIFSETNNNGTDIRFCFLLLIGVDQIHHKAIRRYCDENKGIVKEVTKFADIKITGRS